MIDPITLSVIQAGLQQVCDEMDLSFSRAAFSPVIAEANDRSDGIYSAVDGSLIAQGAGGLPVGSVGRTLALLSGGIDSPVAAWMTMKRGCEVVYLTFHSYPYIGATYEKKVRDLVRSLARFQSRSVFFSVPFAEIQTEIRDKCPSSYRTVLYRRMMHRIADRIAKQEDAHGVVTGDSLGQVASQTLENLRCIEAVADLPILRPAPA